MTTPNPKHWCSECWLQALLVVALAAGGGTWLACLAMKQARAVAALEEMGVQVMTRTRAPEWFWTPLGKFGQTIVRAEVHSHTVAKAMPYLKALPGLEEVAIVSWPGPPPHDYGVEADVLLRKEMPHITTQHWHLMLGFVTITEPVQIPEGAEIEILLERIRNMNDD